MAADLILNTSWHDLGRRKLEAVRACHERDIEALVSLSNTYLSYRGRRGTKTALNTRATYELAIRDWLAYCWPEADKSPLVPVMRATRDDVERYIALLLELGGHLLGSDKDELAAATAATYLAGVRTLYKALVWAGALQESPARDVPAPSDPRPRHERRPALPLEDYRRIVADLDPQDPLDLRNLLLLRLMGDQGLRISEVVHMQVQDVELSQGVLFVAKGKGGKARTVPLTVATNAVLGRWLQLRPHYAAPGETALLVNLGKMVKKERQGRAMHANTVRLQLETLYKKHGVSARYKGAHSLRHTAGTRLYRSTRDLHRVAQILGHQNVNTSSIYAKMDIAGLKEAMAALDDEDN